MFQLLNTFNIPFKKYILKNFIYFKNFTQIKKNMHLCKKIYVSKKICILQGIKKKMIKTFLKKEFLFFKNFFFKESFYHLRKLYRFLRLKKKRIFKQNFYRKNFFFCNFFLKNLQNKIQYGFFKKYTKKSWFNLFSQFNFTFNSTIYKNFFKNFFYHHTHNFGEKFFKIFRIFFKYRNQKKFALKYYKFFNRILIHYVDNQYLQQNFISPFFLTINSFSAISKFFEKYSFSYAIVYKTFKKRSKDFAGYLVLHSKFLLSLKFLRYFFIQKNYNFQDFILKANTIQNYIWFISHQLFYKDIHNFQQYKQFLVNMVFQKPYKKILHNTSFQIIT